MNKSLLVVASVVLVTSTFCIVINPPNMKKVNFGVQNFTTVVEDNYKDTDINITPQKQVVKNVETKVIEKDFSDYFKDVEIEDINSQPSKKKVLPVQAEPPKSPVVVARAEEQEFVPKKVKVAENKVIQKKKSIKTPKPPKPILQKIKPHMPKKPEAQKVKPILKEVKQLTAEEETIVWNQWRANITNEILRLRNVQIVDTCLDVGDSTDFNFKVDKYRRISDIKITATPKNKTKCAQSVFLPILEKINGKRVLEFPEGTERDVVNVVTATQIIPYDETPSYDQANKYNDVEHLIRYR